MWDLRERLNLFGGGLLALAALLARVLQASGPQAFLQGLWVAAGICLVAAALRGVLRN